MSIYQWLCLFGVPTVLTLVLTTSIGIIHTKLKQSREETGAIKVGIQALLRAQLVSEYNKYSAKGYAPIYARENYENVYEQYHSLGGNGVMKDLHDKFFELPTEPEDEE